MSEFQALLVLFYLVKRIEFIVIKCIMYIGTVLNFIKTLGIVFDFCKGHIQSDCS